MAPFGELCERLACGIVEPDAVNAHSGHRRFEGRPALPRILFEHAHDAIGQGRRGFRPPLAQGARRVEEVLLHELLDRVPLERGAPGEELVCHAPQRVLIGEARRLAGPLLRTHVLG